MRQYLIPLLSSLILTGCASSPPVEDDPAIEPEQPAAAHESSGDTIETNFDWPDALRARLSLQESRSMKVNGQSIPGEDTRATFLMHATKTGESYSVNFIHADVAEMADETEAEEARKDVAIWRTMWVPSIVVSAGGRYVGLADEETVERQGAAGQKALIAQADNKEAMRQITKNFDPVESMTQLGKTRWETWVHAWRDQSFELGAIDAEGAPGELVEVFGARERTTCTAEATEKNCVEFVLKRDLQPAEIEVFVDMMKQGMGGQGDIEIQSATRGATVVSNPETLMPYRVETTTTFEARLTGAREMAIESVGVTTVEFDYE